MEVAGFEQHPRCPDRRVLRVSNDESEGLRDFGVSGFHIDGMFMEKPNSHSIYHIIEVPTKGTTGRLSQNIFVFFCRIFTNNTFFLYLMQMCILTLSSRWEKNMENCHIRAMVI